MNCKALSVRQPWAWLIVHGMKDIENRNWAAHNPGLKYRGHFYVHAGQKCVTLEERQHIRDWVWRRFGVRVPADDLLPLGGIVGQASIVDVVHSSASPWFMGPYGLVLEHAQPLPFVRCAGKLGFFNV
jgi:hypothetical protein